MTGRGHQKAFKTVSGEDDEDDACGDWDIFEWIRARYRESRGAELPGTVNPALLETLFREQSSKWYDIAGDYIRCVIEVVSAYNEIALKHFITDDEVRAKLRARLKTYHQRAKDNAFIELGELLKDELEGILQTVNHYFADTLAKIREERAIARLESMGLRDNYHNTVNFRSMLQRGHLSNEDQAVYDINDILKAYYKVGLKRFMDNVILQTTERHLLGAGGPVKNFSPEFVGDLTDAELARYCGGEL